MKSSTLSILVMVSLMLLILQMTSAQYGRVIAPGIGYGARGGYGYGRRGVIRRITISRTIPVVVPSAAAG